MKKRTYKLWIAGGLFLCCLATATSSQAQITNDGTLSTNVTTSDQLNFTITGGSRAGGNLFHSFGEFSVPNRGSAIFNNALDVQNIISRVTGGSISNINGLIRASGSANLFLINPKGIIFGSNASLNIGGSFLASTANRLNFADSSFFSATDLQAQPLLAISVPIGLQFGKTVGIIRNQSQATRFFPDFGKEAPVGLEVQPGKTLALVGGDVFLEGGRLFAPGGRVELGSVAGNGLVSLNPIAVGWALGYEGVQNFQDIQLSQAFVDTTGDSLGDIQLHGRQIAIRNISQAGGLNLGARPGGRLAVKASELVEVSGGSSLTTGTVSSGAAGNIQIETRRLIVGEDSFIDTSSDTDGRGGNLTVEVSDSVEVNGSRGLSQLSTQAFGGGDAGELKVTTGRLILRNGGQISSSTRNAGNGGSVFVDASDSVEVSGQGEITDGTVVSSGLFAETAGPSVTGNGGVLRINTGRLVVQDSGIISVAAVEGSIGQAGTLDINVSESVEVKGIGSSVLALSQSSKPAGDLKISTDKLSIRDGAEVSVRSLGTGDAGNLDFTANSMRLENGGKLTATSAVGEGGNIRLSNLDLLLMRGESEIATDARRGTGNGGNITIDTDLLVGLGNSDITATAIKGRGGNIQIDTQGIFGIEPREQRTPKSDINASSELGVDGIVEINRPDVDPSAELVVLPAEIVDVSGLVAQGCPAGGGNIAAGSSQFVITGRGGLPPTPTEATRSDPVLADLGSPVQSQENRASADIPIKSTSSEPDTLVEAQGWMIGSKGEVVLTASAVTPDIPWLTPTSCNGS
jgi:filamentous hemagglutinin family protein